MRHSSWTLFLVPLALLPVLLLPGATKNTDQKDPVVEARYEQVLEDGTLLLQATPTPAKTLEASPNQMSESLFKD